MINLLSRSEFISTSTLMEDVTETAEPVVDIWGYVEKLVAENTVVKYVLDNMLVEKVYRNRPATYDHVLLSTPVENNFVIIIIDLKKEEIRGHYLLDLNAEYSLT
jgi:hypothetical protein